MALSVKTILSLNNDPSVVESLESELSSSYTLKSVSGSDEAFDIINWEMLDVLIINCTIDANQIINLIIRCHNLRPFCKIILVNAKLIESHLVEHPEHKKIVSNFVQGMFSKPAEPEKLLNGIYYLINEKSTAQFLDITTDKTVNYRPGSSDEEDETESLYIKFLESFRVGVCMADADGMVEYINKLGCRILGYTAPEELLGKPLTTVVNIGSDKRGEFLNKYTRRDWSTIPLKVTRQDMMDITVQANISFSESNPPQIVTLFLNQD